METHLVRLSTKYIIYKEIAMMRRLLFVLLVLSGSQCYAGQWVPAIQVPQTVPVIVIPPHIPQAKIVKRYVLSPVIKMVPIPVHKVGLLGRVISEHLEYQPVTTWEYVPVDVMVIE